MAIETPRYQVMKELGDIELRDYPASVVAQTEVEGDREDVGGEAFRLLAGYIFGNNHGDKKIAMTAPVTQEPTTGTKIAMTAPVTQERSAAGPRMWRVQFMMPSAYTLETLPEPKDPRVLLLRLPPRRVAAIRYSGTWSQRNYELHLRTLTAALKRENLVPTGQPIWARYDPPFKPWFLRTNEILIEVAAGPAPGG